MSDYTVEEELREVHVRFAIAASYGQGLESLGVSLLKLSAQARIPDADLETLDSALARRTLGQLLKDVSREVGLDESAQEVLSLGLEKRNYLVHRFFEASAEKMYSATGRASCIAELREIALVLQSAHEVLQRLVDAYFEKGWSKEALHQLKAATRVATLGAEVDLDA